MWELIKTPHLYSSCHMSDNALSSLQMLTHWIPITFSIVYFFRHGNYLRFCMFRRFTQRIQSYSWTLFAFSWTLFAFSIMSSCNITGHVLQCKFYIVKIKISSDFSQEKSSDMKIAQRHWDGCNLWRKMNRIKRRIIFVLYYFSDIGLTGSKSLNKFAKNVCLK